MTLISSTRQRLYNSETYNRRQTADASPSFHQKKGIVMSLREFGIAFSAALVTLFNCTVSSASTRGRFRAETILNDESVRISAAGRNHTCAVRANSLVSCWENDDSGQIGDGTIGGNRLSPMLVGGLSNVAGIAAGDAHTCALLADGTAKCWGARFQARLAMALFRPASLQSPLAGSRPRLPLLPEVVSILRTLAPCRPMDYTRYRTLTDCSSTFHRILNPAADANP